MLSYAASSMLAWSLAATAPATDCRIEPTRPGQENMLTRAVFADGRLWMRSDAGAVFSVAESETAKRSESLPEPALDLCVRNGHVAVLTCGSKPGVWSLLRRGWDEWVVETTFKTAGDSFVGLDCGSSSTAVVTSRRLLVERNGTVTSVELSRIVPPGLVASMLATDDQVFIGLNRGEWGGGLWRLDARTGAVAAVERNVSGKLCGGPLNALCDPVNGIAPSPWKPGCVVAAIGLVHFRPHGRLVEVCGASVRRLFHEAYGDQPRRPPLDPVLDPDEPSSSVAFFGVIRAGDALVAAGMDALYVVDAHGARRQPTQPEFRDVGGIRVSFTVPGAVLVLSQISRRASVSGNAPMLVAR